ncbi:hypothetical protein PHMEG_00024472 [Phytophthora megakarya]|uniref:Uncharacterized protein n=1 Tax=Phytophthora megakarya TaxID=4795 RepID=A0A225VGX1_9STRA|nr:hypothetical protein PHMEG_00024472 [Phytophthora megakarya]
MCTGPTSVSTSVAFTASRTAVRERKNVRRDLLRGVVRSSQVPRGDGHLPAATMKLLSHSEANAATAARHERHPCHRVRLCLQI